MTETHLTRRGAREPSVIPFRNTVRPTLAGPSNGNRAFDRSGDLIRPCIRPRFRCCQYGADTESSSRCGHGRWWWFFRRAVRPPPLRTHRICSDLFPPWCRSRFCESPHGSISPSYLNPLNHRISFVRLHVILFFVTFGLPTRKRPRVAAGWTLNSFFFL